jgi:hypothetical protein
MRLLSRDDRAESWADVQAKNVCVGTGHDNRISVRTVSTQSTPCTGVLSVPMYASARGKV